MSNTKKKRLSVAVSIWIAVVLLLILVVSSVALLATMLKSWPTGEKNVITLFPYDPADKNIYEMGKETAELEADVEIGGDGQGGNGSGLGGDKPTYENETSVNLFQDTYVDAEGNVTVQSNNGDAVIAPGTANKYEFKVKNTGNVSLDYTLNVVGTFAFKDGDLPIEVRLSHGDEWLLGGEDEWVKWTEMDANMKGKDTIRTLASGKAAIFNFEWRWPYEAETDVLNEMNAAIIAAGDKKDTYLGDIATNSNTKFSLDIQTNAVVSDGAIAVDPDGNTLFTDVFNRLGVTNVGIWVILIVIATLGLIAVFVFFLLAYRREDDEEEPAPVPPPVVPVAPAPEPVVEEPVVVPPPYVPEVYVLPVARYKGTGRKTFINTDTLQANYQAGETVDIESLKAKGLIHSRNDRIKILARNKMTIPLTIMADEFSADAITVIRNAGGTPIIYSREQK